MQEVIKSVGIDIGTSTTQLIFSQLTIENLASSYTVPRISIVNKEVIYRSAIYFTPLISDKEIDVKGVSKIVTEEYRKAGIKPRDLKTGAVIITGETARKQNADLVLEKLSHLAGDFVVATAGPDLESALSGKGAGTDKLSEKEHRTVANLDIGGGTSNIGVFKNGVLAGTTCLDIGGRLIKVSEGRITYVYPKIRKLAAGHGVNITVGDLADLSKLKKICGLMSDVLVQAVGLMPKTSEHQYYYTNEGHPLPETLKVNAITFSGGVAACMAEYPDGQDSLIYGDVGPLLAEAIKNNEVFEKIKQFPAMETIRATVVGAGTHSVNVSGSTIRFEKSLLPMKNVPVIKIPDGEADGGAGLEEGLRRRIRIYREGKDNPFLAVAFSGWMTETFVQVQELARHVLAGCEALVKEDGPLVVLLENDIGKVLGNALSVLLEGRKAVICLDGIHIGEGDYIDIGEPVVGGRVLPVVVKTLVFNI